jgi:hypothetical protein
MRNLLVLIICLLAELHASQPWFIQPTQSCACQGEQVISPLPLAGLTLDLGCDASLSFVPEKVLNQMYPNFSIIFKSGYLCTATLQLKLQNYDGTTKSVVSILNPKEEYRIYEAQVQSVYILFKAGNPPDAARTWLAGF